jgi:hypothetical protein
MAKYKLECYGWEAEALALSLTEKQVMDIQQMLEENGYDNIFRSSIRIG